MAGRESRAPRVAAAPDGRSTDESASLWGDGLSEVARGLLSSAVRCFAAKGFHATTTRDITTGVGLSPAALYVHFPSKEQVLFEIARRGHESALATVKDPVIAQAPDATTRLRSLVGRFVAWHARQHVAARVCQYELSALTPEHYAEIREIRREFNVVFRDAIAAGTAEGAFAPVDVNRVVRGMLSLGIDLVRWYRLDGSDSPEQLGEFYADLALSMVSAAVAGAPETAGRASGDRSTGQRRRRSAGA
jgi:AcrR family transcriptional regulator